jgi:hypothetical protein
MDGWQAIEIERGIEQGIEQGIQQGINRLAIPSKRNKPWLFSHVVAQYL